MANEVLDLDAGGMSRERELWFREDLDNKDAGPAMVVTAKAIEAAQSTRYDQMLRQARVFSNQWLGSYYDLATARLDRRIGPWNVCAAAVSTAQSMVCRSPVKVITETSDAEHSLQRDAKEATRWLYGVWEENHLHSEIAPSLFFDAAVADVGAAVVRVIKKRIVIDRVLPNELIVSDVEGIYGPRGIHQIFIHRYFPKHSVMARYGKDDETRDAISRTGAESPADGMGYNNGLISVYEGWSIQGKHIVAIAGKTLEAEPWSYDFLPVVPMYIDRPSVGYYGRGYVQQLMGYQIQLFEINDAIDEHVRLMTAAKWAIESGTVDTEELNNEIAGFVHMPRGAAPPKLLVGEVPKDLLEERQRIYDTALREIGLNQWSVAGQEPDDRSGKGMELARDKERGRLLTPGLNYEAWHVDLAYVCYALGAKTKGVTFNGRGPSDKDLRAVDFARVAEFMKEAPWTVRSFPASALPDTPEGKRETINGWLKIGAIDFTTAATLLELPDVDQEASLMSSAREVIDWCIEEILEKGRDGYHEPEPLMNLDLGMRRMAAAWNKGRMQGVEDRKLDLMQQWITEAQSLLKPPAPVQVEQRPGVGLAPAQAEPVNLEAAAMAPPAGMVPAPEMPPMVAPAPAGPPVA